MCVCVCARARACVCASVSTCVRPRVCARVCNGSYCMNEIVSLLILTLFIYNFYKWLIVMFCLFGSALCEWNVTKTHSCVHLNVTGKYPCILVIKQTTSHNDEDNGIIIIITTTTTIAIIKNNSIYNNNNVNPWYTDICAKCL